MYNTRNIYIFANFLTFVYCKSALLFHIIFIGHTILSNTRRQRRQKDFFHFFTLKKKKKKKKYIDMFLRAYEVYYNLLDVRVEHCKSCKFYN